ncbi:hypothetical protein C481_11130 [Natrialba asiatica DSM 12278]|uniref:ArsR family transcriptional regulator n=1 Tax=Natrialba asiatica (strain ATCC 700177 / DSM 12278 / JCM 9576 / FERM P-10747 / NBRC 102637 / 172P1) TaxID=29540 RepID=M0AS55_NATA1|nr:hypothetical protein C481_11130 [Natrialba asiatica DSM 12278]
MLTTSEISGQIDNDVDDDVDLEDVLAQLEDRQLVEQGEGSTWTIAGDPDRLRRVYDSLRTTELFNELYGAEDRDEWVSTE